MKLLQINSGIFFDNSQSTVLVQSLVGQLEKIHSDLDVTVRDLISDPVPHLDANIMTAFMTPEEGRTDAQNDIVALSDQLITEIKEADSIVLGLPMYNFGAPSQLKAYFDQLARAGITFKYTETGPVGLLADKPVYVMAARGGIHKDQPSDLQTGFIKTFLQFIGLNNVQFIYAEGLSMGEDAQKGSLETAKKAIINLVK